MQLLSGLLRTINQSIEGNPQGTTEPSQNLISQFMGSYSRDLLGWPQLINLFIEHLKGKISPRRQQLFAIAICSTQWDYSRNRDLVHMISLCKQKADQQLQKELLEKQFIEWSKSRESLPPQDDLPENAIHALTALCRGEHLNSLLLAWQSGPDASQNWAIVYRDLLDGILDPVEIDQGWRDWEGGKVLKLANSIYQEENFREAMPLLADALEEAGCTNKTILDHCRSDHPHFKGCWVIDRLLGLS